MNIDWDAPISTETTFFIVGFYLYFFTDSIFYFWRGQVLWKRLVLMYGEIIFFSLLATWATYKYPELSDIIWITSVSASFFAVVLPFVSTVFEILKAIILYLLRSLWSLSHIKQMFFATDSKNVWVKYLIITTT